MITSTRAMRKRPEIVLEFDHISVDYPVAIPSLRAPNGRRKPSHAYSKVSTPVKRSVPRYNIITGVFH